MRRRPRHSRETRLASRGYAGDTRNNRPFGPIRTSSVNLGEASFICVNVATLVEAPQGGPEAPEHEDQGMMGVLDVI